MGVKTKLTLKDLNTIFKNYNFISLQASSDGVIDTTYIAGCKDKKYIIKKYERDIKKRVDTDKNLLDSLKSKGLNVPVCLDEKEGWYIYEKLKGDKPKNINTLHIQALARFLSALHLHTNKKSSPHSFMQNYNLHQALNFTKSNFYSYYKKLEALKNFTMSNDGFIHGDIFKDNTVFDLNKIGVFDFIDSGYGAFVFDAAVALRGFGIKEKDNYYINLFLKTYNQNSPKKLSKKELLDAMAYASKFYALLRIKQYKNAKKAKELL